MNMLKDIQWRRVLSIALFFIVLMTGFTYFISMGVNSLFANEVNSDDNETVVPENFTDEMNYYHSLPPELNTNGLSIDNVLRYHYSIGDFDEVISNSEGANDFTWLSEEAINSKTIFGTEIMGRQNDDNLVFLPLDHYEINDSTIIFNNRLATKESDSNVIVDINNSLVFINNKKIAEGEQNIVYDHIKNSVVFITDDSDDDGFLNESQLYNEDHIKDSWIIDLDKYTPHSWGDEIGSGSFMDVPLQSIDVGIDDTTISWDDTLRVLFNKSANSAADKFIYDDFIKYYKNELISYFGDNDFTDLSESLDSEDNLRLHSVDNVIENQIIRTNNLDRYVVNDLVEDEKLVKNSIIQIPRYYSHVHTGNFEEGNENVFVQQYANGWSFDHSIVELPSENTLSSTTATIDELNDLYAKYPEWGTLNAMEDIDFDYRDPISSITNSIIIIDDLSWFKDGAPDIFSNNLIIINDETLSDDMHWSGFNDGQINFDEMTLFSGENIYIDSYNRETWY